MSRPALSASRSMRVIDFLASVSTRRFSLTEIAEATRVNRASCLAILGELVQRGYLCRHPLRKSYWLGPALIAAGSAAMAANPLLERAHLVAARLREELRLPVLLSTRIDNDIVCVFSLPDDAGRTAGLRVGERVPLVPPIGASFVAWASPEQAEAWIARDAGIGTEQVSRQLRETLALTRERGFHVMLRRTEAENISSVLAQVSSAKEPRDIHRHVAAFVGALDRDAAQPDTIDTDAAYDIQLIAAPVIDSETSAIYNLCLGGFIDPLPGAAIAALGRDLTAACVEIMKEA